MKHLIPFLVIILLCSCQNKQNQSNTITPSSETSTALIEEMKDVKFPVDVQYISKFQPDTMTTNINNLNILVTLDGKVFKEDSVPYFNIRSELDIEELYFYNYENDIISIYTETDYDAAGSVAKRINIDLDSIIWEASISGFNLAKPVFINNKVYVSSIGFVGKLDLNTGDYDWQFDDLYKDGKYNSFSQPKFFKTDLVLFTSEKYDTGKIDSILIDDNKGKILKMN